MNAHRMTRRLLRLVLPIAGVARTTPLRREQSTGGARHTIDVRRSGGNEAASAAPGKAASSGATAREVALLVHTAAALCRLHSRRALAGVLLRQLAVTNTPDPRQGLIRAGLLAARLGTPPPLPVLAAHAPRVTRSRFTRWH